jgi:hypothetical protein
MRHAEKLSCTMSLMGGNVTTCDMPKNQAAARRAFRETPARREKNYTVNFIQIVAYNNGGNNA